jgi:hypothetical protein
MERVGHAQAANPAALAPEHLRDVLHHGRVAGDDDGGGPVDRGDRYAGDAADRFGGLGLGALDRGHGTAVR